MAKLKRYVGVMACLVLCYALIGFKTYLTREKKGLSDVATRTDVKLSNPNGITPIVIIAYMRSGSTLTGNIIQSHPETFYIFEPLHHLISSYQAHYELSMPNFKFRSVRPSMTIKEEAQNIFRAWFTCDIDSIMNQRHRYHFNFFKLGLKTNKLVECLNKTSASGFKYSTACTSMIRQLCMKSKQKVIKTIRTPIHWLYELMQEFPSMKVIHLVRDPRAIIASQRIYSECTSEHGGLVGCSRLLCTNMEDDITMFEMYNQLFPGRIMRLKYEDLATDPLNTTQSIFKYLDFELTESVIDYVKEITMSGRTPKFVLDSVRPDSKAMVDAWRKKLNRNDLETIQVFCRYAMDKLSYYHFIKPQSSK